jgi:hypothetical protein
VLVVLAGALPSVAFAQGATAPVSDGMAFGPVTLQPRISLTNAGIDTNVFNDAVNPTRDFTLTLVPALDSRLRMRRASLASTTSLELLYFAKAKSQRSASVSQDLKFAVELNHVAPFLSLSRRQSAQRINAEIDARVKTTSVDSSGGVALRLGARTTLRLEAGQSNIAFGDSGGDSGPVELLTPVAEATPLASALDRRSLTTRAAAEIRLTPLTTVIFDTAHLRDRFVSSTFRDNDAWTTRAGFSFQPFALISGDAAVGFQQRTFRDGSTPDFTGLVASVNLRYVIRDQTVIHVTASRDVDYSFEADQPYFVTVAWGGSVTQALGRRWDAVVHADRAFLNYQAAGGAASARRDRNDTLGAGTGFRLRDDVRIGIDATQVDRRSGLPGRQYSGLRVGGTFAYAY